MKTEQYEYRVMQADSLPNGEQLTEISKDGWRVVAMCSSGVYIFVYFERKIKKSFWSKFMEDTHE